MDTELMMNDASTAPIGLGDCRGSSFCFAAMSALGRTSVKSAVLWQFTQEQLSPHLPPALKQVQYPLRQWDRRQLHVVLGAKARGLILSIAWIAASLSSTFTSLFRQERQRQDWQKAFLAKHSQYNFRHPELRQLQPMAVDLERFVWRLSEPLFRRLLRARKLKILPVLWAFGSSDLIRRSGCFFWRESNQLAILIFSNDLHALALESSNKQYPRPLVSGVVSRADILLVFPFSAKRCCYSIFNLLFY